LTCGLVRSNFALAIWPVSFSAVVAVRRLVVARLGW
jgi:hypothetical protein